LTFQRVWILPLAAPFLFLIVQDNICMIKWVLKITLSGLFVLHFDVPDNKLPKLLDRHHNGVTLFVWLGTWQCHTIVLSLSLTSVVHSLPLLYIYLLFIFRPSSFIYLKFEVVRKDVMKRQFKLWYSWVIAHLSLNNNQSINIVCKPW
jgi:hypothetical protein